MGLFNYRTSFLIQIIAGNKSKLFFSDFMKWFTFFTEDDNIVYLTIKVDWNVETFKILND